MRAAEAETVNQNWIWLLHDDSAPQSDALEELLEAVERAPSVTVAGAKQVEWHHHRRLVDVGLSISRWAERLTLIDVDELDQGQYDSRSDMFAVNSAGMLIRWDVWDSLGGFDPALPGTGDDVDFCWRNRLAGHRVVVVPASVVQHAGSRNNHAGTLRSGRRSEVYLRLKHARLWKVPFLAVGAVLGGVARLILGLLAKDPGYGFSQLFASIAAVLKPIDLFKSRRSASRTRKLSRNVVRALRTDRREVWSHRRSVVEAFSARGGPEDGATAAVLDVPSGDAQDDFAALDGPARTWVGVGAVASTAVLAALSIAGMYRLVGAPALAGGSLLPLSADLGAMWANASGWWVGLGSGMAGHGDPFGYVLWLLSVIGFGSGNAVVVGLVILAMPLSGLSAWFAAGALSRSRGMRLWAAFFWASVPALHVAMGSGRLGALLAHVLLPLVALGMIRAIGAAPAPRSSAPSEDGEDFRPKQRGIEALLKPGINSVPSWTAAAAAGLLLAALVAGAPSLFPLMVVAVLGITLAVRKRAKTLWWALLPPFALFLPFVLSTLDRLRAVVGDPGVPVPFAAADMWQQVLGFPVAFDPSASLAAFPLFPEGPWPIVAALLIGGPVVLLAASALFLPGRRRGAVRVLWLLGILALLASAASGHLVTAVGSSALITPFTGPFVSVFMFTMLAAAVLGGESISRLLRARPSRDARPRRRSAVVLAAAVVVLSLGPAASLTLWVVPQLTGTVPQLTGTVPAADGGGTDFGTGIQLAPSADRTLPATATDRGFSEDQSKSLVLNVDGDNNVSAALMRGGGTTMDELSQIYSARNLYGPLDAAALREDDDATANMRRAVAVIVAGTGVDPRKNLQKLGVGFVVLQQSDTAAEVLAGHIDSVPGLVSVGNTNAGWLWRVVPPLLPDGTEGTSALGARARIVNEAGATEAAIDSRPTSVSGTIAAGGEGRRLVLTERTDPGWQATLDGRPLQPDSTGWAQAFALPQSGGNLEVRYVSPWEPWAGIAQAIIIGLTVLLAVPIPARPRFVRVPPGRVRQREEDSARKLESAGRVREPQAAAVAPSDATDQREAALSGGRSRE